MHRTAVSVADQDISIPINGNPLVLLSSTHTHPARKASNRPRSLKICRFYSPSHVDQFGSHQADDAPHAQRVSCAHPPRLPTVISNKNATPAAPRLRAPAALRRAAKKNSPHLSLMLGCCCRRRRRYRFRRPPYRHQFRSERCCLGVRLRPRAAPVVPPLLGRPQRRCCWGLRRHPRPPVRTKNQTQAY